MIFGSSTAATAAVLAIFIGGAGGQRFRMGDDNPGVVQGMATADKCPHILLLGFGVHDTVLFKRRHLNRA